MMMEFVTDQLSVVDSEWGPVQHELLDRILSGVHTPLHSQIRGLSYNSIIFYIYLIY